MCCGWKSWSEELKGAIARVKSNASSKSIVSRCCEKVAENGVFGSLFQPFGKAHSSFVSPKNPHPAARRRLSLNGVAERYGPHRFDSTIWRCGRRLRHSFTRRSHFLDGFTKKLATMNEPAYKDSLDIMKHGKSSSMAVLGMGHNHREDRGPIQRA